MGVQFKHVQTVNHASLRNNLLSVRHTSAGNYNIIPVFPYVIIRYFISFSVSNELLKKYRFTKRYFLLCVKFKTIALICTCVKMDDGQRINFHLYSLDGSTAPARANTSMWPMQRQTFDSVLGQ